MFRKAEALHPAKHKALRIVPHDGYAFARETLTLPVVFSEMADIAREYPLLFQKNTDSPVALMGAEAGVNAYFTSDGQWQATYKPARIAAYPFALMPVPDKPAEMALVVDTVAEQISHTLGFPLFDAGGKPTPDLQARLDVLKKMKEQEATTARMVRQIREAGLLVERSIRVSQTDNDDRQITGLEFVDEKALNGMAHEDFAKLRDGGVLPLIYAHLLSMSNLRHGVIAGKYVDLSKPDLAASMVDVDTFLADVAPAPAAETLGPDLDLFADEGDFHLDTLVSAKKTKD